MSQLAYFIFEDLMTAIRVRYSISAKKIKSAGAAPGKCVIAAFFLLSIIFFSTPSSASALKSRQNGADKRFRVWNYHPDRVYHFTGYYLNPTYIEFEKTESILTISTAKPASWYFVKNGNRLFIKPVADDAEGETTIMTNKRIYHFEFHTAKARGPFDENLPFVTRFRYPKISQEDPTTGEEVSVMQYSSSYVPDLSHPEKYNFNYSMSGNIDISPIKVFDDGQFTYLQFKSQGDLPAIFLVQDNGLEAVSNFRVIGDYMVVEKITSVLTLRRGSEVVCIFNENERSRAPTREKQRPKKWWNFWKK